MTNQEALSEEQLRLCRAMTTIGNAAGFLQAIRFRKTDLSETQLSAMEETAKELMMITNPPQSVVWPDIRKLQDMAHSAGVTSGVCQVDYAAGFIEGYRAAQRHATPKEGDITPNGGG